MREQRRGRKIAMTPDEIDAFLSSQRVCRVATIGAQDRPHVAPLWFVWDGSALWLYSIVKSQRWTDIQRRPQLAIVIDAGTEYVELHGVEFSGTAEVVGEIPRMSSPDDELARPELLFARKYFGSDTLFPDGKHAWLRVTPEKLTSWDFRKLYPPSANDETRDWRNPTRHSH